MEVFYTGTLNSFGNDNSNRRRMCCSSIGIDDGNILYEFCYGI